MWSSSVSKRLFYVTVPKRLPHGTHLCILAHSSSGRASSLLSPPPDAFRIWHILENGALRRREETRRSKIEKWEEPMSQNGAIVPIWVLIVCCPSPWLQAFHPAFEWGYILLQQLKHNIHNCDPCRFFWSMERLEWGRPVHVQCGLRDTLGNSELVSVLRVLFLSQNTKCSQLWEKSTIYILRETPVLSNISLPLCLTAWPAAFCCQAKSK